MSLDTDLTTLDAVDLTADVPCCVPDCAQSGLWRANPVGCTAHHFWPYCTPHRIELERALRVAAESAVPVSCRPHKALLTPLLRMGAAVNATEVGTTRAAADTNHHRRSS